MFLSRILENMEINVNGHCMARILVLVVLGTLLSDQGCDGAGVRRLTRRRKVLPGSGKTPPQYIKWGQKLNFSLSIIN